MFCKKYHDQDIGISPCQNQYSIVSSIGCEMNENETARSIVVGNRKLHVRHTRQNPC